MSLKSPGVFICILLTVNLTQSYGFPSWKLDQDHRLYRGEREKRASYPLNPFLFSRGLYALNQLLFKAKRVWTPSRRYRKYEKFGDENDAVKDFYSISPENIEVTKVKFQLDHTKTEGLVYKGTVGDREVRLLRQGDGYSHGRPVIDVVESRTSSFRNSNNQPYIDRFIYKNKSTKETYTE